MKVIRRRRGWRVSLSDPEMGLLKKVVALGLLDMEHPESREVLSLWERRFMASERWADPLATDEDRRAPRPIGA